MARHNEIMGPAANLLGVALIVITGLHVGRLAVKTYADEIAAASAVALSVSCFTAYLAVRAEPRETRYGDIADRSFLVGMVLLFAAVVVFAMSDV